jgi:glutamate dehydrogenase (NADP+)
VVVSICGVTDTQLLEKKPEYRRALAVVQIPERIIQFRVTWERDDGSIAVNRGYRVQFNSALGPYKGGLRLHPTVNLSILKFLGFEHIGDNTDVPAGDIGTGGREIGFMFGAYKKIRNEFAGILTGKGGSWGGSFIRPEATGYGLVYYVTEMLKDLDNTDWNGKKVLISGSGNVAQYAALKVIELGGSVLTLSDSTGSLVAKDSKGFTPEDISSIADIKLARKSLTAFDASSRFEYHEGKRPWTLVESADVALPSATQNEVSEEEAKALARAGVRYVAEGSNMGCTQEAINVFEESRKAVTSLDKKDGIVFYAPGKAANCGGVAVSGLEMAQNSQRLTWTPAEVDAKLKDIMVTCYKTCWETGTEFAQGGVVPSLVAGANIAGFMKVADAMRDQGEWW